VKDVEDVFIQWGKELSGEHCLNILDGTRPLSETLEKALRKAISESLKNSPRAKEARRKLHENNRSKSHTEEHKRKIGEASKGRTPTDETKDKLRASRLGKPLSEETRLKLHDALVGKKLSDETNDKMSAARKTSPRAQSHIRKVNEARILPLPEHEIYALHKAGETYQQIAKKFSVCASTIHKRLRKYRDLLSWGLGPGF